MNKINPKTLKLLVFDLDGTLVDSLQDISVATNIVLERWGRAKRPLEEFNTLVGWGLKQLLVNASKSKPFTAEDLETAYQNLLEYYRAHPVVFSKTYSGITQTLNKHKNTFLYAVLSNKEEKIAKAVIETLFPHGLFKEIVGGRPGVPHKPDPQALLTLCNRFGVEPKNSVLIGDSGVDMQTAKAAGCWAIGVQWGFRSVEELENAGADMIFQTPEALETFLS